jgi:hypothetical protein
MEHGKAKCKCDTLSSSYYSYITIFFMKSKGTQQWCIDLFKAGFLEDEQKSNTRQITRRQCTMAVHRGVAQE